VIGLIVFYFVQKNTLNDTLNNLDERKKERKNNATRNDENITVKKELKNNSIRSIKNGIKIRRL
jgi:hypothetical protein